MRKVEWCWLGLHGSFCNPSSVIIGRDYGDVVGAGIGQTSISSCELLSVSVVFVSYLLFFSHCAVVLNVT